MGTSLTSTLRTVVSTGAAAVGKVLSRSPGGWPADRGREDPRRWRVVTVNRPPHELQDQVPGPLSELGNAVEVQIRPAPGDKGTEIWARLRAGDDSDEHVQDQVRQMRSALRQTKQLAEVGWVLQADEQPTPKVTARNTPLRVATEHAGEEGRL